MRQIIALNIEPLFIIVLAIILFTKFRIKSSIIGVLGIMLAALTYHLYTTTVDYQGAGINKVMTVEEFMIYIDRLKWMIATNKIMAYGLIGHIVFKMRSGYVRCA